MKTQLLIANHQPAALLAPGQPLATPFVDLMLDPVKLEAALKNNFKNSPPSVTGKRMAEPPVFKNTQFQCEAPSAACVKLAADFTDWEKAPLDMVRDEAGNWFTLVPLLPGQYAYRFIVDGEWRDDPHSIRHVPNAFGGLNAVKHVL